MFTDDILKQFNMKSLDGYKEDFGDSVDTEIGFYKTFLFQTDYIDNKLNEEYFLGASKATLKGKYGELLELRQQAREKIKELES